MKDAPRKLRELVTKWREIENAETKIPGTAALDGNDCADELETALAAATPPERTLPNVGGAIAKHAIITPQCRENRTPCAAFEEAISRVFDEYMEVFNHPGNEDVNYHLVLTVERHLCACGEPDQHPWPCRESNEAAQRDRQEEKS